MNFPKTEKIHKNNIGRLPCIVSGGTATVHHAQGPSIRARLVLLGFDSSKSLSMRGNGEALLLPLAAHYHTGAEGIDGGFGRRKWEETFGEQAILIDQVSLQVGYDLWELHKLWYTQALPKIFRRRI